MAHPTDALPVQNPRSLADAWSGGDPALPHVLLVVDQFPKALGGGERTVLRLATLLPHYGFRASVLTFSIHPGSTALSAPLPFPVYLLPLNKTYNLAAFHGAIALGRFLRSQQVQIVHTFFESSDLWAGGMVKLLSSAKLVWSRRDMGILRSPKHRLAYRLMADLPDHVFAVSDRVRQHAVDIDGIDPDKVTTIYNGLDLPQASAPPPRSASRRFTVTTVGNIRRVKGHDILIRAAAIVLKRFPLTSFTIAGEVLEPAYYAELQELVRTLGIEGGIHFTLGAVRTIEYLQQADLFVLPSRSEGFSNAILEAMACSLPVIATDVGGNAEAVLDGLTGYLVPSEDPTALASAIKTIIADQPVARRLGEAGRLLVAKKFSTKVMMSRVTALFRQLVIQPE